MDILQNVVFKFDKKKYVNHWKVLTQNKTLKISYRKWMNWTDTEIKICLKN